MVAKRADSEQLDKVASSTQEETPKKKARRGTRSEKGHSKRTDCLKKFYPGAFDLHQDDVTGNFGKSGAHGVSDRRSAPQIGSPGPKGSECGGTSAGGGATGAADTASTSSTATAAVGTAAAVAEG